jgi:hypothetical protein
VAVDEIHALIAQASQRRSGLGINDRRAQPIGNKENDVVGSGRGLAPNRPSTIAAVRVPLDWAAVVGRGPGVRQHTTAVLHSGAAIYVDNRGRRDIRTSACGGMPVLPGGLRR